MIGIISVTEKGDILGKRIISTLGGDLYCKSKEPKFSLDKITGICFEKYTSIIFISSTGIAVRAVAKYLQGKDKDPAIVVVDVCNKFSISLVSGHLGGANRLAKKVSDILNNRVVITTATDNMEVIAPDIIAMENNLIIENLKKAKDIASRLVNGKEVYFKDDKNYIECPNGYIATEVLVDNTVWVTNKAIEKENVLKLIRKNIVLGIGCKRNTTYEKIYDFVSSTLKENNIDLRAVKLIASIDVKKDEKSILQLKDKLNCKVKFFSKEEILAVESKYEGSEFVKSIVGVAAVSEPVIELSGAILKVSKVKRDGITLAIGEFSKGDI
jgi:cobalt-precorrin 5A hydrolase